MWLIVAAAIVGYGLYDYSNYKRVKERGAETRRRVDYIANQLNITIPDPEKPNVITRMVTLGKL